MVMARTRTEHGRREVIAVRVSEPMAAQIDAVRGKVSRSEWMRAAAEAALSGSVSAVREPPRPAPVRRPAAKPAVLPATVAGDGKHAGHHVTANGRNTRAFCETCKRWFDADVDTGQPVT